jgi:hypothetical protein
MDDSRCIVQFKRPASYDSIITYAETAKKNFADIRKYRPQNIELIKQALNEYLKQCLFENCFPNNGYIKALGFSDNKEASRNGTQPGENLTSN